MTWLRTDEKKEAIDALEKLYQFLKDIEDNTYNWKWVIITTHIAVQNFMILAIKGSDLLNVYDKDSVEIINMNKDEIIHTLNIKMDNFINLYHKIKSNKYMRQYIFSKAFRGNTYTLKNIKELNKLRNKFIHFTPQGWSLEINGLPVICLNALNIIKFLIKDSGNIRFNEESNKYQTIELIDKIIKRLKNLDIKYSIS